MKLGVESNEYRLSSKKSSHSVKIFYLCTDKLDYLFSTAAAATSAAKSTSFFSIPSPTTNIANEFTFVNLSLLFLRDLL